MHNYEGQTKLNDEVNGANPKMTWMVVSETKDRLSDFGRMIAWYSEPWTVKIVNKRPSL